MNARIEFVLQLLGEAQVKLRLLELEVERLTIELEEARKR